MERSEEGSQCVKCGLRCVLKGRPGRDELFGAPCDSCKLTLCKDCAGVSTTEAHAIGLVQRNILFFCSGCKREVAEWQRRRLDLTDCDLHGKDQQIEKLRVEYEQETEKLALRVSELELELKACSQQLGKQRKLTQDFTDDVLFNEEKLLEDLKSRSEIISRLNRDLISMGEQHRQMEDELLELRKENHGLVLRLSDLDEISRQMVQSMRMLEADNLLYTGELHRLRNDQVGAGLRRHTTEELADSVFHDGASEFPGTKDQDVVHLREEEQSSADVTATTGIRLESSNHGRTIRDVSSDVKKSASLVEGEKKKKERFLILSDEQAFGLRSSLGSKLDEFLVQSIIKPGARFLDVIGNIVALTKNFTKNDYVLILAGSNDFFAGGCPSIGELHQRLKLCTHTNIILSAVPFSYRHRGENNPRIFRFNKRLSEYSFELNKYAEADVLYADINSDKGWRMKSRDFASRLTLLVNKSKNLTSKNLIFVTLQHDLSLSEKQNFIHQPRPKNLQT